jgi:hypothetical protein
MKKKVLIYLVLVVVLGNLVLITMVLLGIKSQPHQSLPNPNGYDDFLKAGQLVTVPKAPGPNPSVEELRTLVTSNAEALKLVRAGLNQECRVPIYPSPEYYAETNQMIALECKALDMVLESEARLAEMEHRTNDALKIYLEAIRFSHESSHGGFKINAAIGEHCEAGGLGRLRQLMNGLDAVQCREAIQMLETMEEKREPIADVLDRDKKWWHNHASLSDHMKFIPTLAKDASLNPMNITTEELEKNTKERQKQARQLIIDLAARCYELEKGARPKNAADLVPAYLKSIPQDPFTGTNMVTAPKGFANFSGSCLCPANASMPKMLRQVVSTFARPIFLPVVS